MLKLNDREWKAFKITDLFDLMLSSGDNQLKQLETGNFPLVSSGSTNNGVVGFIKDGDGKSQLFKKNVITVDMFGKAFCHTYNFFSVSHGRINILVTKYENTHEINIFIAKALENSTQNKFSYNVMCSQDRLSKSVVLLPIDKSGNPDYGFMNRYIAERETIKRKEYLEFTKSQLAQIERE